MLLQVLLANITRVLFLCLVICKRNFIVGCLFRLRCKNLMLLKLLVKLEMYFIAKNAIINIHIPMENRKINLINLRKTKMELKKNNLNLVCII